MSKPGILIIDDDPGTCETLSDIFQEKGFDVVSGNTGHEAIDKARDMPFNVALVDISLPDMDGTALLREFAKSYPGMACIIITGHASLNNAISALKDGARGYFVKPLVIEEVLHKINDVLDRQRLQRELEKSEERYRRITDAITNYIYTVKVENGRPVETTHSETCFAVTGYTWQEFADDPYLWIRTVPEEDHDLVRRQSDDVLSGNIPQPVEHRIIKKDGLVCWVESTIVPNNDINENLLSYDGIVRDISERKQAEQELERACVELAQKNKEMEQVMYVTSHDLRTPLVNIDGFSKELELSVNELISFIQGGNVPKDVKEKVSSIVKDDIPESLKYITMSISKMDFLLAGLLKLSRLGRFELNMDQLDINSLMSEVLSFFESRIKNKGIKLEISELPPCMGDETHVDHVFTNLIDNSIKFLDPGRSGIIRISGYKENGQSVYCIEDNGTGIAPEYQEKVFDIFHRLEPDKSKGEGLGLAIVNRVVERHNGKVWVESMPDRGSKFYVSLPDAQQENKEEKTSRLNHKRDPEKTLLKEK